MKYLLLFSVIFSTSLVFADTANIAAASDLQYAFKELKKVFEKRYPTEAINFQFGSSGKFYAQIQHGAPYDLFFSADMQFPKKLKEKGLIDGDIKPYATGRIAIMSNKNKTYKLSDPKILLSNDIKKIAIANPDHAPYGKAAVSWLKTIHLYDSVKHKLVYGENIMQTTQFVQTQAADIGIIALSIAKAPDMSSKTKYSIIDKKLHVSIIQGYGVLKRAKDNKAAKAFVALIESDEGAIIMRKYGFTLQ